MVIKIPLSWLRTYCDIPWSVEELVDRLIMTGLEVDSIETIGSDFDGFVVGRVESIERHPNADRLSLCSVDVGTEILQIICGAPNVAADLNVPVAKVGSMLPGGLKIKKARIRGVESFGMICSEAELNLSENHDGIMVFDNAIKPGQDLQNILGDPETILSIDIGTNRPDCLSLVGIAREITALTGGILRMPSHGVEEAGPPVETLVNVHVEVPSDCHRFVGRVITGVRIGPSPAWLKKRVEAAGIRSISNVVDVTNYVMLEMGQPLHAYDLDQLAGNGIIVRRAYDQELFTTLDGVERKLDAEVLMIADHERGIGVGGVMGGLNTEITSATNRVFLEGACFDSVRVRRSAKTLQLQTDASRRFERGMDPELQGAGVSRAAALIAEVTGGTVATGMIDCRESIEPNPVIPLRINRVNGLLGTNLDRDKITTLLEGLRFEVQSEAKDLLVRVPSFRRDISREVDLIEEVARLYGYDRIEPVTSLYQQEEAPDARKRLKIRRDHQSIQQRLREKMTGFGFTEVITHSLVNPERNKLIDPSHPSLIIENALSPNLSAMRTSLAASVLNVVRWNVNRKVEDIRIFEVGRVFWPKPGDLPEEPVHLCIAVTGNRYYPHWDGSQGAFDFFDLKGIVEVLVRLFGLDTVETVPYDRNDPLFDSSRVGELRESGSRIGCFGAVSPLVLDKYEIREPVWMGIIDCGKLFSRASERRVYQSPPKYPAVERDLAVIVPDEVSHREILEEIRDCCGDLLEAVELFDVYRGEQIAADRKSMAFAMLFRSDDRTLTDVEISSVQDKVLRRLVKRYRAELRA